jgi:nucleoid-associated protein YgaU
MKRYANISVGTRWDGKRVFRTVTYPVIHPSPYDITVVTNEGDFLDTLAFKYYGDPTLYWIIARANGLGKGRMSIPAGYTLRIATDVGSIISEYNRLNSI